MMFTLSHLKNWNIVLQYQNNLKNFGTCHTLIWVIDEKHVALKFPKLSGTEYFNYEWLFSVILITICDANYCFTYVDFRQYGCTNDRSVLRCSGLYQTFEENNFHIPPPAKTEDFGNLLLYYLLEDEIFPLKPWLMIPYPGLLDDSQENI